MNLVLLIALGVRRRACDLVAAEAAVGKVGAIGEDVEIVAEDVDEGFDVAEVVGLGFDVVAEGGEAGGQGGDLGGLLV